MTIEQSKGAQWAQKVYDEKLASGDYANLGPGFSSQLCAARSVAAIAERKLYLPHASKRVLNPELTKWQRQFWNEVNQHALNLCVSAQTIEDTDHA